MKHKLKSYDESQPGVLSAEITTQPESISVYFHDSQREILIEQSSGVLQVRAYDGEHDSPLSTLIPEFGPMYVESGDYESEIK